MTRVIVSGATGKVGRELVSAIEREPDLELAATAAPSLGRSLADALGDGGDVVIDFTAPAFAAEACEHSIAAGVPIVLGTSGIDAARLGQLGAEAAARGVQLFHAANFAIGAVLMMRLAAEAARFFPDAEIVELHGEGKKDAPSGTARATAELLPGEPAIHSVRLPGLVAHQEVLLGGKGQLLTIRHDAFSREAYVPGVLLALERLRSLPPGLTVGLATLLEA